MRVLWISKASVTASFRKKLILLAQAGFEIGLVTGASWGTWQFEADPGDQHIQIFQLPQRLSGRNHFHWYRGMAQVVRAFKPDLLHIDEEHYSVVTTQAARLARRYRIPFVFQTWQNIYKRYPFPFSAMERYVFRHAHGALAGTHEVAGVLRRQGFDKPVWIVPLGVDTDQFFPTDRATARAAWNLNRQWTVGFVGRLVPEKGVDDLAQAMVPLLHAHPEWQWVVAGAGPLAEPVQQQIHTQHLDGQLRMIPWLSTTEMTGMMNALDTLVVPSKTTPSWKEQFGRVLIEAMAVGLPIVAYGSGEIPQVVAEAGIVVPEGDIDALRTGIARVHDEPGLRDSLAQRGLVRVHDHFSQARVAALLKDIYNNFL